MSNWQHYIPSMHTIVWLYVAAIITWKLTPFLRAMREACSEKLNDGSRGKVSIKRIIPLIFTLLICYMVIVCMHNEKKTFNETAFWGILFFIALATTVITVTQANGLLDKINILKGKILETKTEETNINTKTEEVKQAT